MASDGSLKFSAHGLMANASQAADALGLGLLSSAIDVSFEASTSEGPWAPEAYEVLGNLPFFSPKTPFGTCFLVC